MHRIRQPAMYTQNQIVSNLYIDSDSQRCMHRTRQPPICIYVYIKPEQPVTCVYRTRHPAMHTCIEQGREQCIHRTREPAIVGYVYTQTLIISNEYTKNLIASNMYIASNDIQSKIASSYKLFLSLDCPRCILTVLEIGFSAIYMNCSQD